MCASQRWGAMLSWLSLPICLGVAIAAWSHSAAADCDDGEREDNGEECDDGNLLARDGCSEVCRLECDSVGAAATLHTCLHAQHGPFESETGAAYQGQYTEFAAGIDTPHTLYTIAMASGSERTVVSYWPTQRGTYAFYMKAAYPVEVRTPSAAVPVRIEHALAACDDPSALTWVRVYELSDEAPYNVIFGPLAQPTAVIAVERLESFLEGQYSDVDADGWGDDDAGVWAWCTLPGRVLQEGDCDDRVSSIYPGAPELCNGVDDDCNTGTADICPADAGDMHDAGTSDGSVDATLPDSGSTNDGGSAPGDAGSDTADADTFDAQPGDASLPLDAGNADPAAGDAAPSAAMDAADVRRDGEAGRTDARPEGGEPTHDEPDGGSIADDDDPSEPRAEPGAAPRARESDGCALNHGATEGPHAWLLLLGGAVTIRSARRRASAVRRG
jgi:cysteine-rich repeat protein